MTPIELVRVHIAQCFVRLLSRAVFFALFWPVFCIAAQSPGLQRVLVLYSEERLLPSNVIFDQSLRATLQAGATKHIEFHSEFLDEPYFSVEAHQEHLRDFLKEKDLDYPPDLLIAASRPAAAFLLKYRASLFTGAPVIYLTCRSPKSCALIRETSCSLIEIALEVGYTSPSHFAQVFRLTVGIASTQFRNAL